MTDLTVLYRACPIANKKPKPIDGTKMDLIKMCYDSFVTAFSEVNPKIVFIIDNPDYEITELFESCPFEHEIETHNVGNVGTFHRQLDLARKIDGNVFLLEDDYYFLEGAGRYFVDALNEMGGQDFITPYDHPDYYRLDEQILWENRWIEVLGDRHWKRSRSTTLTFAGTGELFDGWYDWLKECGIEDFKMWDLITSGGVTDLWSPVPSLATHMEADMLSPVIDWGSLWK